ncbi:MAG TPA: hypothetical protein VF589_13380 [Allosphingosinicella sp.]|jgi:hypothetical protein
MLTMKALPPGIGAALLLAGCDAGGGTAPPAAEAPEAAATQPAMKAGDPDQILKVESAQAVFDGFESGDLVWAMLSVPGKEDMRALVALERPGLEHFLAAHAGKPLTLRVETIRTYVEQAGGAIEAQRIADAQTADTTAAAWWQTLDPDQRRAAEAATERLIAPSAE